MPADKIDLKNNEVKNKGNADGIITLIVCGCISKPVRKAKVK